MNIPFHHSLRDADRVLKRLRSLAKKTKLPKDVHFVVESLVNCREQGYAIMGSRYQNQIGKPTQNFYVSFAQHRSSDSVIVCLGMSESFDWHLCDFFAGNIASDEVYKQARTFQWTKDGSQYIEAAEFILDQMVIFATDPKRSIFFLESKKEVAA